MVATYPSKSFAEGNDASASTTKRRAGVDETGIGVSTTHMLTELLRGIIGGTGWSRSHGVEAPACDDVACPVSTGNWTAGDIARARAGRHELADE